VASGAVVISLAAVVALGWRFSRIQPGEVVAPPTQSVPEMPAAPTDPFTIQVAAYLKMEDARHFVARLKDNGLDAFWNEATSAHRKWFQVKVSHFATKAAAQAYAEQLKAKGLIDDFYVANYTPPPGQP
ncbi:MAG: SPOR domain-containing protein, partial [Desulfosarcinaceae bacterium]